MSEEKSSRGCEAANAAESGEKSELCCPSEVGGKDALCCPPKKENPRGSGTLEVRTAPGSVSFADGVVETPAGPVQRVRRKVDFSEVLRRWAVRWGIGRYSFRIPPGLYAFGSPGPDAHVLVTCNFKLTFDQLRRAWRSLDAWVLVLDTKGINVWCAAGKGTFGTEEVIRRVERSGLASVVSHRELVLPQLGAPGVAAHEVKKRTGFRVSYGPVRAVDVPDWLAAGMRATEAMREVTFTLRERAVLTPVELTNQKENAVWAILLLAVLSGVGPGGWTSDLALARGPAVLAAAFAGLLSGAVLVPILLPWIPGRHFAAKGARLGLLAGAAAVALTRIPLGWAEWMSAVLASAVVSSYLAMNFTGATPYTSPSGVEREMRAALPWQIGGAVVALAAWTIGAFFR